MDQIQAQQLLHSHGLYSDLSKECIKQFTQACKDGNLEAVKAFVALGLDLETHDSISFETPLIRAAEGNNTSVIRFLVEAGADLENRDSPGDTALLTAVNWGHLESVKILVELGADVNAANNTGWTPLTKSMEKDKKDFFQVLLDGIIQHDAHSENGQAPSQYAINQKPEYLQALLEAGANPNCADRTGDTLLMYAVRKNLLKEVKLLIVKGADFRISNRFGWTAAMMAKALSNTSIATWLEDNGADCTDLYSVGKWLNAAETGNLKLLKNWFTKGTPNLADMDGITPLMKAAKYNHTKAIDLLLQNGADPNREDKYSDNALSYAVINDNLDSARQLLAAGANPNTNKHKNSYSTFYYAISEDNVKMVKLLLEAQAELNQSDYFYTNFVYGERNLENLIQITKLLAKHTDYLEKGDRSGEPLICGMVGRGKLDMVKALVEAGVDINKTNNSGNTALHKACEHYDDRDQLYADVVSYLLEQGADFSLTSIYQQTPLQLARSRNHPKCIEVMESFMFNILTKLQEKNKNKNKSYDLSDPDFFADFLPSQNHATLLEWVRLDRIDIVEGLLNAGLSPNASTTQSTHPLSVALENKNKEMIQLLLDHGAEPNNKLHYGLTPFMAAVDSKWNDMISLMLEYGADPNQQNEWHTTAVHSAVSTGELSILELLYLHNGNLNPNPAGSSLLMRAVTNEYYHMIEWLLYHGAKINIRNSSRQNVLSMAIEKENYEIASTLIKHGVEINVANATRETPLIDAVKKGNSNLIELLLTAGADPYIKDNSDKSAWDYAGYRPELKQLFEKFDNNSPKQTISKPKKLPELKNNFLRAIYKGDFNTYLKEFQKGASLETTNYRGDTPLIIAVAHGHGTIVDHLIESGANLYACNDLGDSAMSYAFSQSSAPYKNMLEEKGVALDMDQLNKFAALSMRQEDFKRALKAGDIAEIQEILESHKIDYNHFFGLMRPLNMAIDQNDLGLTRMMLEMGADPTLNTTYAQNALKQAQHLGHKKLAELIRQFYDKRSGT